MCEFLPNTTGALIIVYERVQGAASVAEVPMRALLCAPLGRPHSPLKAPAGIR